MLSLLLKHPRLLLFGLLTAFFSGPGQTFLVSLFISPMREAFHMSQSMISGLYSIATLCSAFVLPVVGYLIDRIALRRFIFYVALIYSLGLAVCGLSQGPVTILIGFFIVRNLGQGTLTVTASTIMARYFGAVRGKALSISNLGFPLSEAVLPLMVSLVIGAYGWRAGWMGLSVFVLIIFIPLALWLLSGGLIKRYEGLNQIEGTANDSDSSLKDNQKSWTVKEMLRDWRFYTLILPGLLPPGLLTGLFFHQNAFMKWKGWDETVFATALVAFAVARAFFAFVVGPLVDKYSARRLFAFCLTPLAVGIFCLLVATHQIWAFFFLGFLGVCIGLSMTVKGALWAELYGTKHLGAIKGIQSSLTVLATAITPFVFGLLLDYQIAMPSILIWLIGITLLGVLLAALALNLGAGRELRS
jgi:MFS family permease